MAYLGTFHIDDYVGIPAATHRFSSGAAYAPTALTYSIYEEATTTGLDEDVDMTVASPFDSITGCYWVRRQLTAAAGFEVGKNYLVVVKATVDSVAAIQMHTFQVEGDVYARLGAPAGASVSADIATIDGIVDDILTDTAEIGVAGAGLTNINLPNQTMDITGNITGNLSGSVGSVTGAVGSVTGNVGGNVTGSVGSVAAGGITAASIATNAIDADALAADAVTEIQSGLATAAAVADVPTVAEFEARTLLAASYFDPAADTVAHVTLVDTTTTNTDMVTVGDVADAVWDEALAGHAVAGSAGATLSAASAPTAADVADAVWDEALAGHAVAGSTGAALSAAGAAGDPWSTALPGAYADGTAGDIIGNLVTDIGALTPAVAISATTAASVSTGALAVRTYHSLSQAISSTYSGDLSAATKLWLAVKAEKDDTDAQAVIFIEKTAGLTVLAGAAYTTVAHGSLTVGGLAGAWTVTVAIDEVATGLLTPYADGMLWAECKALVAGSTVAVWDGVCDVARGIVVAVS